jgi:DNA polymerase-3 subunit beta
VTSLTFNKADWLSPMQILAGAVDKKQLLPILSTILVRYEKQAVYLTATDLEIELTVCLDSSDLSTTLDASPVHSFTLPAKKFLDLLRNLEEDESFEVKLSENNLTISTAATKFRFFTLPPDNFPLIKFSDPLFNLSISRLDFIQLLQSTAFAISQQDVRVFLNGMLIEFNANRIVSVAADGHRMSISTYACTHSVPLTRIILPRKSVTELLRLLHASPENEIELILHPFLLRIRVGNYHFSTKLIDSQFLPYHQAVPKKFNTFVLVDRDVLKKALSRCLIIAIDKSRPVILEVSSTQLSLVAQNQEQEQAVETMSATVDGLPIKIGTNPYYLLDVLSIFPEGLVRLSLLTSDTSVLVESVQDDSHQYILMPMKI